MAAPAFNKIQSAILTSFAHDAYGLQYEWIYDVSQIKHPLNKGLGAPGSKFLAAKQQGEFTMYGDQQLLLLRSVVQHKKHDVADFAAKLQELFNPDTYKGWITSAIKETIANLKAGKPLDQAGQGNHVDTNYIAGTAPLLLVSKTKEEFVQSSVKQALFTTNTDSMALHTRFFANVIWEVAHGQAPVAAINSVAALPEFATLQEEVQKGLASKDRPTTEVVAGFGPSCGLNGGFPNALHLIAKYENDINGFLEANYAAGGDSAGRGIPVSTVLALYHGAAAIPAFAKDMKHYDEIVKLIS